MPNTSILVQGWGFDGYLRMDPGSTGCMPYFYFWEFPLSETLVLLERRPHGAPYFAAVLFSEIAAIATI